MSTSRLEIVVDCDGVLTDFASEYVEIHRELVPQTPLFYQDIRHFDFAKNAGITKASDELVWRYIDSTPGLVCSLQWVPEAKDGLEALRALGRVRCLTSPHTGPTWMPERFQWLLSAGFSKRDIGMCSDKGWATGDVLVDDKPENLEDFGANNTHALLVLFDQPWNRLYQPHHHIRGRYARAMTWWDVVRLVRLHGRTKDDALVDALYYGGAR